MLRTESTFFGLSFQTFGINDFSGLASISILDRTEPTFYSNFFLNASKLIFINGTKQAGFSELFILECLEDKLSNCYSDIICYRTGLFSFADFIEDIFWTFHSIFIRGCRRIRTGAASPSAGASA